MLTEVSELMARVAELERQLAQVRGGGNQSHALLTDVGGTVDGMSSSITLLEVDVGDLDARVTVLEGAGSGAVMTSGSGPPPTNEPVPGHFYVDDVSADLYFTDFANNIWVLSGATKYDVYTPP